MWCTSSGTQPTESTTTTSSTTLSPLASRLTWAHAPEGRPVVFLCRSGNRSIGAAEAATEAGIAPSYNVLDGFEGNLDEHKHRGGTGWKAVGLPWKQS